MIRSAGYDKQRAKQVLAASGLNAYVAGSPENVFYITGYPARHSAANSAPFVLQNQYPSLCVIDAEGEVTLIAWIAAVRDREFDVKETVPIMDRATTLEALIPAVKSAIGGEGKVGVDDRFPSFAYAALHNQSFNITVDEAPLLSLRLRKSEEEKNRIRKGTEISEKSIEALRNSLKEGVSDLALILRAKQTMLEFGADCWDHATIPIDDSNAEITNGRQLKRGDVVGLDLGAIFSGYSSDTHRKFAIGEASSAAAELELKLAEFVSKCGRRLKPGEPFAEIYNYVSSLYEEAGISFVFPNVGHSLGIQTEEANITYDSTLKVEEDAVINIELYGASEDGHFMGLEDTFILDAGVPREITRLPRELLVS